MTVNDLIAKLPPTGLAMLAMALDEAADTATDDDLVKFAQIKTATKKAGSDLWGHNDYSELCWMLEEVATVLKWEILR